MCVCNLTGLTTRKLWLIKMSSASADVPFPICLDKAVSAMWRKVAFSWGIQVRWLSGSTHPCLTAHVGTEWYIWGWFYHPNVGEVLQRRMIVDPTAWQEKKACKAAKPDLYMCAAPAGQLLMAAYLFCQQPQKMKKLWSSSGMTRKWNSREVWLCGSLLACGRGL